MKRTVILMGIAALAFASCAKDTVKEVNLGQAIDFRVATQTRAAETTTANLEKFDVTAISTDGTTEGTNYFTGLTFETDGSYYHSDPVYYWPGTGALNFYAYSPVGLAGVSITKDGKTVTDFAPAATVADQVDFVVATATGDISDETTGVALAFTHELTQVNVKAMNSNEGYTYTVKAFKVGNVVGKADYDFTEAEGSRWTLSDQVASYTVEFDEMVLTDEAQSLMDETTESGCAMLLPQQLVAWTPEDNSGTYFAVLARVETSGGTVAYPKDGSEYGWLAVAVNTEWKPGYKYVYTLDFTKGAGTAVTPEGTGSGSGSGDVFGGEIMFTTEVATWSTDTTTSVTIEKTLPEEDEE